MCDLPLSRGEVTMQSLSCPMEGDTQKACCYPRLDSTGRSPQPCTGTKGDGNMGIQRVLTRKPLWIEAEHGGNCHLTHDCPIWVAHWGEPVRPHGQYNQAGQVKERPLGPTPPQTQKPGLSDSYVHRLPGPKTTSAFTPGDLAREYWPRL